MFVFNFNVSPTYTTSTIIFDILTDNYGSETTWSLTNSLGAEVASGPTALYGNATAYQETITIPTFDECYTFTIFDSASDGICCGTFGNGSYTLEDENGNNIKTGGVFSSSESVLFNVQNPLSVGEFDLVNLIDIYPNPVNDNLTINLTNINENVDYQIFNTLGQAIQKGNLNSNGTSVLYVSSYQSGIYFIKLSTDSSTMTQKLIKK